MRLALALCLAAAPALAQDTAPEPPVAEDGFSLIEEGARLFLRGLMAEMEPALEGMDQALDEVGPALEEFGAEIGPRLRELVAMIDDFANYGAPVMLPNGDILIPRKTPLVPPPPDEPVPGPVPGPDGSIEL